MVWAGAGRIASCNDGKGAALNYRLIFYSGPVLLMLPNHRITVYTSRNRQVTLEGNEYVMSPFQLNPFCQLRKQHKAFFSRACLRSSVFITFSKSPQEYGKQ